MPRYHGAPLARRSHHFVERSSFLDIFPAIRESIERVRCIIIIIRVRVKNKESPYIYILRLFVCRGGGVVYTHTHTHIRAPAIVFLIIYISLARIGRRRRRLVSKRSKIHGRPRFIGGGALSSSSPLVCVILYTVF